jgi:uroporphyrinogen decarboxylase
VEPLLVRAARREPVERTPVWFMRQAGRSLPEYRAIRERHAFFEINRSAELTAEVTLQPVHRHGVDAAVMFADIMTPVVAMGAGVELVEGVGPVVAEPVRSLAAVERLVVPDPAATVGPVLDAIGIVRRELGDDQAVIGFCGGPFTVAGYLVEGRPSRDFAVTKALMYNEPAVWNALMEKLSATFAVYALAQATAGADAVQLFDSWIGALSPADYAEFAAPWSATVLSALEEAGVPAIHFGTGASTLLPAIAGAGGDVIGLDWRIALDAGWAAVGPDRAVQGNLDPAVLLGPWERIESAARDVLARAGGRPGHIFNLGHGVLPGTDPDMLGRLRELVHTATASDAPLQNRHTSGTPA